MRDPANAEKHLGRAKKSVLDFFTPNSLILAGIAAFQGRKPGVAKSNPELYETLLQQGINQGLSVEEMDTAILAMNIGVPKTAVDVAKAVASPTDTATKAGIASGLGVMKMSPASDINNYLAGKFSGELAEAQKSYGSIMKAPVDVTEARLESDFKDAMKSIVKPYTKLKQAYDAAVAAGQDEGAVYESIAGKTDEDVADMIADGTAVPAELVYADLEKEMDRQIDAAKTDEEALKIEERWEKKLDILDNLMDKYGELSIEEINKGALDG